MDKYVDYEIYYELCEQLVDEATLSYRRKVLPTRMLRLSLPDRDTTYQTIGEELLKSGQFHKSIFPLKRVTIMDPHNNTAQIDLARALFGLEKENEAFSSIKKALSLNPKAECLHNLLITELEERDRLQDHESFSKEIINMVEDPEYIPAFYFASAEALVCRDMNALALEVYRKAMEADPPMRYDQHYHYGLALHHESLFEEAIAQFEHAKKLNPNVRHTWNSLAYMNYCLGRVQKAREEFEEIIWYGLEINVTYSNFLLVLHHLDKDEGLINQCKDWLEPYLVSYGYAMLRIYNRELRITQALLGRDDIDEKMREFNTKKLKAINFVLSLISEGINSREAEEAQN